MPGLYTSAHTWDQPPIARAIVSGARPPWISARRPMGPRGNAHFLHKFYTKFAHVLHIL